jgi:S1-C subfamily serine protease
MGATERLGRRLRAFHEIEGDTAVRVAALDPQGPAAKAGLRALDLLIAAGDRAVGSIDDLHRLLTEWPSGRPLELVVVRGTEKLRMEAVSSEAPQREG